MASPKYGGSHQAIRAATLPTAYGQPCTRCGRPMFEGQELDLDHNDNGVGYRGFSHATCNRAAGGRLGRARQLEKGRRPMLNPCVLAVAIAEDRSKTSIVAAGHADGLVGVELVAYLDGSLAGVDEVLRLRAERTVSTVVIDGRSPAATLIRPLTDAGVTVTQPSTSDLVVATGQFQDLVSMRKVRIVAHPALDAAARFGTQRPLAGAQAWERRGALVDIGPLDAATLACWGLVAVPPAVFFGTWR